MCKCKNVHREIRQIIMTKPFRRKVWKYQRDNQKMTDNTMAKWKRTKNTNINRFLCNTQYVLHWLIKEGQLKQGAHTELPDRKCQEGQTEENLFSNW